MNYLTKDILIGIEANGLLTLRNTLDSKARSDTSLPFHSTDTCKEAEMLIVTLAKLSRENNKDYFIPNFKGTSDAVFELAEKFREIEKKIKHNKYHNKTKGQ